MTDIEDLLVQALHDDRRALTVRTGSIEAVVRTSQWLQLRRRLALGATAVASVAAIALGTMLADGGSAQDGKAPSYPSSVSAQPRTS